MTYDSSVNIQSLQIDPNKSIVVKSVKKWISNVGQYVLKVRTRKADIYYSMTKNISVQGINASGFWMYDNTGNYANVPANLVIDKLEQHWYFVDANSGKTWLLQQSETGYYYNRYQQITAGNVFAFVYCVQPGVEWINYLTSHNTIENPVNASNLPEDKFVNFMAPIWLVESHETTWKDELNEWFVGSGFATITVGGQLVLDRLLRWAIEGALSKTSETALIKPYLENVDDVLEDTVPLLEGVSGTELQEMQVVVNDGITAIGKATTATEVQAVKSILPDTISALQGASSQAEANTITQITQTAFAQLEGASAMEAQAIEEVLPQVFSKLSGATEAELQEATTAVESEFAELDTAGTQVEVETIKERLPYRVEEAIEESGSGNCFTGDTLVVTKDGFKYISEIQVGDQVCEENPETGAKRIGKVTHLIIKDTKTLVHVFIGNTEIRTTSTHPFWIEEIGWVSAGKLVRGDKVKLSTDKWADVTALCIEELEEPVKVYNFEVEGLHTYFVTSKGVLVHNVCNHGPHNWANADLLGEHFDEHGSEFGAASEVEYAEMANDFYNNAELFLQKVDDEGILRVYDLNTNTFGSYTEDGFTITFFKPDGRMAYWRAQQGEEIY
jgi:hypothetical protein